MNKLACFLAGVLRDLTRDQAALLKENAFLRAQLEVYRAQFKRPRLDAYDRVLLVFLSKLVPRWREFLTVVTPETLGGWANEGFRAFWERISRRRRKKPTGRRLSEETLDLIREWARETTWGSKRIVGELFAKLSIRVHKKTVQKILREERPRRPRGQKWSTFLHNHLNVTWACDFFTVPTWFFGQIYVLFFVKLGTREVLHWNVTYHPTSEWTTQQLKNVLAWCGKSPPRFLLRDRDDKFGSLFDEIARGAGVRILVTGSPFENAHAERFVGTVRREVLKHFVVIGERHLRWILGEFVAHFNAQRPHQGIGQKIPADVENPVKRPIRGRVVRRDVLNGLIQEYSRAA
jgi:putative transposase